MCTYGGMREMSVLDPLPAVVGLTRVVSIVVHPSPLNSHAPVEESKNKTPLDANQYDATNRSADTW